MSRATRRLRSLAATLRGFTFYLAVPISSIRWWHGLGEWRSLKSQSSFSSLSSVEPRMTRMKRGTTNHRPLTTRSAFSSAAFTHATAAGLWLAVSGPWSFWLCFLRCLL